jgi:hypothetical protein
LQLIWFAAQWSLQAWYAIFEITADDKDTAHALKHAVCWLTHATLHLFDIGLASPAGAP